MSASNKWTFLSRRDLVWSRMLTSGWLDHALQWAMIAVAGILIGGFAVVYTYLPRKWGPLLALAVLVMFAAMMVKDRRRLLLSIVLLDTPFQLDFNFFYNEKAAALGSIGGLALSVTSLLLLGLYAMWLGEALTNPKPRLTRQTAKRFWLPHIWPLFAYVFFTAISVASARNRQLAIFEVAILIQVFLLYIYLVGTVRTPNDLQFIISTMVVALVLESLVIIALHIVGHTIVFAGFTGRVDSGDRVAGTIGSPNSAGAYLSLTIPLAISILFAQKQFLYKWLAILGIGLGSVALIFTLSRGGWIAFSLALGLILVVGRLRSFWSLRAALLVICGLALVAALFGDTVIKRIASNDEGSASTRVTLSELAYSMIEDHPVRGVGANNSPLILKEYVTLDLGETWLNAIHNKYLLVWAETGIGGLLAFVWFLFITIYWGWRASKTNNRFIALTALCLTAAVVGHMTHLTVDIFHSRANVQVLWVNAGLIAAIHCMEAK